MKYVWGQSVEYLLVVDTESRKSQVCTVFRLSKVFLGIKLWQGRINLD